MHRANTLKLEQSFKTFLTFKKALILHNWILTIPWPGPRSYPGLGYRGSKLRIYEILGIRSYHIYKNSYTILCIDTARQSFLLYIIIYILSCMSKTFEMSLDSPNIIGNRTRYNRMSICQKIWCFEVKMTTRLLVG